MHVRRYGLMLKCWEADVDNRICFEEIVAELTGEASKAYPSNDSADSGYVKITPHQMTETPQKEPVEVYTTENSDMDRYITVISCHDNS